MKRFFPLIMGLTLILLSFANKENEATSTTNELTVESPIVICEFMVHPTTSQWQCDPSAALLTLDSLNCTGSVKTYLRVTNLDPNPVIGQSYSLPVDCEPIFYHYTYGGNSYSMGPINSFVYRFDHNGQYPVYEWSQDITVDVVNYCNPGLTQIFMDVSIKDQDGFDYDLSNEHGSDGIFQCEVFKETCYYCGNPSPECATPGDLNFNNVLLCGETCTQHCPKKLVQNEEINTFTLDQNLDITTEIETLENHSDPSITVTPNPFLDQLNLTFAHKVEGNVTVQLMDQKGSIVLTNNYLKITDQNVNLNVTDLPSGFYYCKVINGKNVFTEKIIKL